MSLFETLACGPSLHAEELRDLGGLISLEVLRGCERFGDFRGEEGEEGLRKVEGWLAECMRW